MHPLIQKRLSSVYLKAVCSYSYPGIGFITGLHPNAVARWINVCQSRGYEGLLCNNYGTNQSEPEEHSQCIPASLRKQPPRSAPEAAERSRELTGVERSREQARTSMKRHGLKFIKCGHLPAKADKEKQHQWAEDELSPAIEAARKGKVHLLFLGAAHFMLQPFVCCLWCVARIFIKAAPGRNRIHVLKAVHAITKPVATLANTTYRPAETLIDFLRLLKKKFPAKPIVVVLDNARYQHCQAVTAMAESPEIRLLFLPPYPPHLNLIERLRKFTKKQILCETEHYQPLSCLAEAIAVFTAAKPFSVSLLSLTKAPSLCELK